MFVQLLKIIKKLIMRVDFLVRLEGVVRLYISYVISWTLAKFEDNSDAHVKSVLFVLHGGVGDAVMALPALYKLSKFVSTNVVLIGDTFAIASLIPSNVNIIQLKREHLFNRQIRKKHSQMLDGTLFIFTSPILEMHFLRLWWGLNRAVGFMYSMGTITSYRCFGLRREARASHRTALFSQLAAEVCKAIEWGDQSASERCDWPEAITKSKDLKKNYVVFAVSKTEAWKMGRLSEKIYAEVATWLIETYGCDVLLVGSKSERLILERVKALTSNPKMINLAGKTDLKELELILKASRLNLCNDNGVAHISAFSGAPTLTLFTFSDPNVYKWGANNYDYIFHRQYNCMPCVGQKSVPQDNYPVNCKFGLRCRETISVNMIQKKIIDNNYF